MRTENQIPHGPKKELDLDYQNPHAENIFHMRNKNSACEQNKLGKNQWIYECGVLISHVFFISRI